MKTDKLIENITEDIIGSELSPTNPVVKDAVVQQIKAWFPQNRPLTVRWVSKNANGHVAQVMMDGQGYIVKIGLAGLPSAAPSTKLPTEIARVVMSHYEFVVQDLESQYIRLEYSLQPLYSTDNFRTVIKNGISDYERFTMALELIFSLRLLHFYDIVHGDLKPENIVLAYLRAVLIDFDDAMLVKFNDITTLSKQESLRGTDHYIAPESIELRQYSKRSDIYALAVILAVDLQLLPPFKDHKKVAEYVRDPKQLVGRWQFEDNNDADQVRMCPDLSTVLAGLSNNPADRPTLELLAKVVIRLAKNTLTCEGAKTSEEYDKIYARYEEQASLLTFLEMHQQSMAKQGGRARTTLAFPIDTSFEQICEKLAAHASRSGNGVLGLFTENRTRTVLKNLGWLDGKLNVREHAPRAFKEAWKQLNPAANSSVAPPVRANADETPLARPLGYS